MFKHKLALLSAIALLSFGTTQLTFADEDKPCQADAKKFCADIKPGGGRLMKCMKEHEADLSPACKEKGQKMHEHMDKAKEACKDDAAKLCKDVEPGEGRMLKCMKDHESDLSQGCKDAMKHK
jgi:hypothetical protein